MITIRTKSLTQHEVDELHRVLVLARNQMCVDSKATCKNCEYKHICDNLGYTLKYLKNAKAGR